MTAMSLEELAERLRELASGVDALAKPLYLPAEEYDLSRAVRAIRSRFPGEYFTVDMSIYCSADAPPRVCWHVYVANKKQGRGNTLTAAVQSFLLQNPPDNDKGGSLAEAQAEIDKATPPPL